MRRVALPERADWKEKAEKVGFTYHHADDRPYWDEGVAYAFTLGQIEQDIETAVVALEDMCLEFVERAVRDEAILSRLAIPELAWDMIAASWQRGDRNLYGRYDFAYDGASKPKLLEYNADTPTALFETGYFQWVWLEDMLASGKLPAGSDQFNSLHDKLVAGLKNMKGGMPYFLHLTCLAGVEDDLGTIGYLAECAAQAKLPHHIIMIEEIGQQGNGVFVDENGKPIDTLFKLYPWEWLLQDEFGKSIAKSKTQMIEPAWKMLLSNKGLMAFLHEKYPTHPNLLPAFFEDDPRASELQSAHVRKPLLSREGANITLVQGGVTTRTDGPYDSGPAIVQADAHMPSFDGAYPVVGAWIVASEPAGMCIREDDGSITTDKARFIPHYILP